MGEVYLTLPCWPPSTNRLWRSTTSKTGLPCVYLDQKARAFYNSVKFIVSKNKAALDAAKLQDSNIGLSIKLFPPDKRKRDIDNVLKALLDSLTKAGAWQDDSQVSYLEISKCETAKGGLVKISIWRLAENAQASLLD